VNSIFPTSRSADFDPGTHLALVTAAGLAYCNEDAVRDSVGQMDGGVRWIACKKTDTQCFVAWNDKVIVVSFRGSSSLRDWITNAQFVKTTWPEDYAEGDILRHRVHKGFARAVDSVFDRVRYAIFELHDKAHRIYFTGHSLGGDLAMMTALIFSWRSAFAVEGVYTYGAARWCDYLTARDYNVELKERTFRVVNSEDIVPRVPGILMGYRHVGQEVYFTDGGKKVLNPSVWRKVPGWLAAVPRSLYHVNVESLADHNVEKYRSLAQGFYNFTSQISDSQKK